MKLAEKRRIVAQFKAGRDIVSITVDTCPRSPVINLGFVEQVIRDYCNGEFTIPRWFTVPKRKDAK